MEEYGFCNKAFHENMKTPATDYVGLTAIYSNRPGNKIKTQATPMIISCFS
jgi:hypothetical protein